MKFSKHLIERGIALIMLLLCPLILPGATAGKPGVVEKRSVVEKKRESLVREGAVLEKAASGGERSRYVLGDVRVKPVPVMLASNELFQLRWTMEKVSGVEETGPQSQLLGEPSPPTTFSLSQNYPNPFNPSTTISFTVPEEVTGTTSLWIYDIRGRMVRTLVDEDLASGKYSVHWRGRNERGESVSSGVYLYKLIQGENVLTRKMTVVR
jgi:hypothetical protein